MLICYTALNSTILILFLYRSKRESPVDLPDSHLLAADPELVLLEGCSSRVSNALL